LAYLRDEVVGWCHAAPRDSIPHFAEPALDDPEDKERRQAAGAIVCLLVAPAFRRMGVARQLIRAACEGFRSQGLTWAEASPSAGDPASAQNNYHGHLSLYLDLGFRKVESSDGQWFVRQRLKPAEE
jgi:ribosomal protein S18 acetylase RimI-like enzyme